MKKKKKRNYLNIDFTKSKPLDMNTDNILWYIVSNLIMVDDDDIINCFGTMVFLTKTSQLS